MDELIWSTSISESGYYGERAAVKQYTTREECNPQKTGKHRKQKVISKMSKIPQKVVNNLRARISKKPRKKLVVEPVDLNYKSLSSKHEFIINTCDSFTSTDSQYSCSLPYSQPSGCHLSSERVHRSLSCFTDDSQHMGSNDMVALLPEMSFDSVSNTSSVPEKDEIVMRPVFSCAVPNALVNDCCTLYSSNEMDASYDDGYTSIHVAVSDLHNFQNSPLSSTASSQSLYYDSSEKSARKRFLLPKIPIEEDITSTNVFHPTRPVSPKSTNTLLDDDAISIYSDEGYPSEKRIRNISIDRFENLTRLSEFQKMLHCTRSKEDIPLISQCSTLSSDYTECSEAVLMDLDGSVKYLQDYRERSSPKENFIGCNQAVEFYDLPLINKRLETRAELVKVSEVITTDLDKSGKYLNEVATASSAISLDNQKRQNIISIKTNNVLFAALCSFVILTTGATLLAILERHKIIDVHAVLINFLDNILVHAANLLRHYYLRIDNASILLVQLAKDSVDMLRYSSQFGIDEVLKQNAECMLANEISQNIQASQRFDEMLMTAVEFMMQ